MRVLPAVESRTSSTNRPGARHLSNCSLTSRRTKGGRSAGIPGPSAARCTPSCIGSTAPTTGSRSPLSRYGRLGHWTAVVTLSYGAGHPVPRTRRPPQRHSLSRGSPTLRLPNVMMLVVEDACTVLSREDWRRREPARWRPQARHRWPHRGRAAGRQGDPAQGPGRTAPGRTGLTESRLCGPARPCSRCPVRAAHQPAASVSANARACSLAASRVNRPMRFPACRIIGWGHTSSSRPPRSLTRRSAWHSSRSP
jgi:hypothetical protein